MGCPKCDFESFWSHLLNTLEQAELERRQGLHAQSAETLGLAEASIAGRRRRAEEAAPQGAERDGTEAPPWWRERGGW